ncbi:uroporphyrinogen decarboxylase [Myxococcota bacterium]|nr:uroporphyrinogen decarboxylase [Myxococcota bacterium]MCZ7619571.1 uroporphyrinogen decarboxylase [Myxococcota bacterium]
MSDGSTLTRSERLLRACRGEAVDRPPVWLMRQAGRYLPEYRAVRAGLSFLDTCRDVERAVEISLQPLRLVGTEAVILFSDIFVPVLSLGIDIDFQPGPVIATPIRSVDAVERLTEPDYEASIPYVFEILRRLRAILEPEQVPLLGFAGAPFTLAAYLVEGQGSRHFAALKRLMYAEPDVLRVLLDRLTEMTVSYLNAQIDAGAQVVQLFDSWAGILAPADYRRWVLPTHRAIAERVDRRRAPLILYVNDGAHVLDEMAETGADVLSLDWRVDLADAAARVGRRASLQGNLDPCALAAPPDAIAKMVGELARAAAPARGHVLNLGHGCLPETPIAGVRAFTEAARKLAEPGGR